MSSVPGDNLPDLGFVGADKFAHFSEFLVLGILLTRAMLGHGPKISLSWAVILSIIISVFYAAIDEGYQAFIPGRHVDVLDFATDVGGVVLGTLLCLRRFIGARDKTI